MAKYTLLSYKHIPYKGFITDEATPIVWELTFRVVNFWGFYSRIRTKKIAKYQRFLELDESIKLKTEKELDEKIGKTFNYYLKNKV